MKGRALSVLLLPALATLAVAASVVLAGEDRTARIENVEIRLEGEQIHVGFRLVDVLDEALLRRIESGLPTEFEFQIELERDRKRWFDTRIRASTLRTVAMYNAVKREYLVNTRLDGKLILSRVVADSEDLERQMTVFEDLPVFAVPVSLERERVLVRVRALLGTRTILFFIPTTRTTPWAASPTFTIGESG